MTGNYNPAGLIDHTLLKADASADNIRLLCKEAERFGFYSVCINPSFISTAREFLKDTPVKISTVIGFPLGANSTAVKVYESIEAVLDGADELDIVMNVSRARDGRWEEVRDEIRAVVMATPAALHKVIIETGLLKDEEIREASIAAVDGGAEFIKTSTGFGPRGASIRDIEIIMETADGRALIKASGGIKSAKDLLAFINAGADRIGTSSGVKIMEELYEK